MANGQDPGTDVRPKKQYVAGFLDQATSAIKLKLKHMAEANKRGFTINKLTTPFIGLLIKISNTKIVVKVPLDDICTQCYKENLFGDKTRRKKIEQAAAPYLKPLVHSDFYTSHPYIYPYIIPMSKLNTKIFYIETDWIDAELQLLLGMQVRKPEGSQDPRLKISDVSRWTCSAESLSLIACCNMAATKWLKSFEEKEEGVLMSVMTLSDLACGLLYAFHMLYKKGGDDMPKPKGEGDVIVVLPVPTVFFLTTSKNYAGLCYIGKEVLRFVDDPEVITTKAMRMTEYVDEKGEKLQRFRLYRPNVTSEEGSVPENAEQLAMLSDALENIRREKDRNNSSTKEEEEEKEEVCETSTTGARPPSFC
ncbi:uncharacterized protein LOC144927072 [Branchiostoma floridae x Branchiostoma belcheri]